MMTLNENPTVAHRLIARWILTIQRMIFKHPQNGRSKGMFTLLRADGQQGKLAKVKSAQRWKSTIYLMFLPVHHMENFYHLAAGPKPRC